MQETAYVSRRYFQLKSGHTVMGTYLKPLGKIETDLCLQCISQARIDTDYTIFYCMKWREKSRKMRERCEKEVGDNLG